MQTIMKNKISIQSLTYYYYEIDEDSEQRLIEENGANKSIKLRDGRMTAEDDWSPLQIQVWPVPGEKSLYYVRLRTSHYSFCLKNSCVIRDISEFYQLRNILTVSKFSLSSL